MRSSAAKARLRPLSPILLLAALASCAADDNTPSPDRTDAIGAGAPTAGASGSGGAAPGSAAGASGASGGGGAASAAGAPTCADRLVALQEAFASLRACTDASECGQVFSFDTCGCTRAHVLRNDADPTAYQAMFAQAADLGCILHGGSTCDCPQTQGFECVNATCGWNYVHP